MTRVTAAILLIAALIAPAAVAEPSPEDFAADVDWLVGQIEQRYAYFDGRGVTADDLQRLSEGPKSASSMAEFITRLETFIGYLHDHHFTLGTNTVKSYQLIPSGTDLWVKLAAGSADAEIEAVRPQSVAWRAGLRPRMRIPKLIYDRPIFVPAGWRAGQDYRLYRWQVSLAGTHEPPRRITACKQSDCREYVMGVTEPAVADGIVSDRRIDDIGYLRIENSLGDMATIAAFDAALEKLSSARALILDLRNTPSGGSTDVAEPIMGRFIAKESPYQRVFVPGPGKSFEKDSWLKTVAPRGETIVMPMVVLVDRWTGSMGEGMAIGFDALGRAEVVGTRMAGLLGGIGDFKLPRTGIVVKFPIERLYHVDGTPREDFVPPVLVRPAERDGEDPALETGLKLLGEVIGRKEVE
jgi:hypothetical protein